MQEKTKMARKNVFFNVPDGQKVSLLVIKDINGEKQMAIETFITNGDMPDLTYTKVTTEGIRQAFESFENI